MYNLITEATEEEIKKMFVDKFDECYYFYSSAKFTEEGGKFYMTYFGKNKRGNFRLDLDGNEIALDGPYQGLERRIDCNASETSEIIKKSPNEIEAEKLVNQNIPCLFKHWGEEYKLRKSKDGDLLLGYESSEGGYNYFNPSKKTIIIKGGERDGSEWEVSCDGDKIKIGNNIKSGTTKKVTNRTTPKYFEDVSSDKPIIYGMRDNEIDGDGLITQIQKKLKELGHYTGEPDGQFGPITYQAVIAFQKANKDADGNPLKPDGKIGPKTIEALGLKD